MKSGTWLKLLVAGAAVTVIAKAVSDANRDYKKENFSESEEDDWEYTVPEIDTDRDVYFVGGGLASLAGAAYLIHDCGMKGDRIHIFEGRNGLGGGCNSSGNPEKGYFCPVGLLFSEENNENLWELLSEIPSLKHPTHSVKEEILNFSHIHPVRACARLVDRKGHVTDVSSMGFSQKDRNLLMKLLKSPEEDLEGMTIQDWFQESPHIFETIFWQLWQSSFGFRQENSLLECKRYLQRFLEELNRLETMEDTVQLPLNQEESFIAPLREYLSTRHVDFRTGCTVEDLELTDDDSITVTSILLRELGEEKVIKIHKKDLCFVNGSIVDSVTYGDLSTPAPYPEEAPVSAGLWTKIASKKKSLGAPHQFFGHREQTEQMSFTVTSRGDKLQKLLEQKFGYLPGSGGIMTLKDSNWMLSITVPTQPYFSDQPEDVTILCGYGLFPNKKGDFVQKSMCDCTGEEILIELLLHLQLSEYQLEIMATVVNVIPVRAPFAGAPFQPRTMGDRPFTVPESSVNLAVIGQFAELPEERTLSQEYAVRTARTAVYELMGVDREVCPIPQKWRKPKNLVAIFHGMYR